MLTRQEHLEWAKTRALEYCDQNDVLMAFQSLITDLNKHPKLQGHVGICLGMKQLKSGFLSEPEKMREFIKGFN
ncbi:MAG: hypothetical protein AAFY16_08305 [Cyanobacteria bacterium J06642_3]